MSKWSRRELLSASAVGAAALMAPRYARAQGQNMLQVGASLSLSGALAQSGAMMRKGYEFWLKELNASGGLLGRQAKLVVYDDQSDPSTSAKLYEKLITEDKVDLVIGPYGSATGFAASAVTEKHKYPLLLPASASEAIFKRGFKYVFQLFPPISTLFEPLIGELADRHNLRRIALVHSPDLYPKSVAAAVEALAKRYKRDIVLKEEFPLNATDLSSLMLKIRSARPEVIIAGAQLPDSVVLIRQLKETQYLPKAIAMTPGPLKDDFGQSLGKDADGVMGDYLWDAIATDELSKTFKTRYEAEFNGRPDVHSAFGWSGGKVLEAAVKKAGSLDPDRLREAFLGLEMRTLLPGVFKLDPQTGAQLGLKLGIVQWQKGERQIIAPADIATSQLVIPLPPWGER
jgi:branched-chain amino acid transport system substrate-binding protein